MSIDHDAPTSEQLRDTAAERDAHYFLGNKLEPFSIGRQLAAQRLAFDGASPLENDILLVFLCTLPPDEVDRARGEEGKQELRRKMQAWAESQGITIAMERDPDREGSRYASPATRDIQRASGEIWNELAASEFKVKRKPGEAGAPADPNG